MVCPSWSAEATHSGIDSFISVYGTVATVLCDDGFVFDDGSVSKAVKCIVDGSNTSRAVWNLTDMSCRREL